jgi:hypothetical protein
VFPLDLVAGWVLARLTGVAQSLLKRQAERKAFNRALDRALCAFDTSHPSWHEALLDKTFLQDGAAPVLADFVNRRGVLPDAAEIAQAWTRQFPGTVGTSTVDEAELAITELLEEFHRQLAVENALQEFLDRLAWDRTAASAERIAKEVESLSAAATRERVTEAINGLAAAALAYEAAAGVSAGPASDRFRDYRLQARTEYDKARRALIFMRYPGVDLCIARFRELVIDPYEDVLDAVDGAGVLADALAALEEAVDAYLRFLDEEL